MEHYIIRQEKMCEQRQVESLIRESFWNVYRPGCLEHYVLHCLREDKDIHFLHFISNCSILPLNCSIFPKVEKMTFVMKRGGRGLKPPQRQKPLPPPYIPHCHQSP